MTAPPVTQAQYLPRHPGYGSDIVVEPNAPEETIRHWVAGDAYPRLVWDIANRDLLAGDGTVPPVSIVIGTGAPVNASYVTMSAESGLSNETTLANVIRRDVLANRGAFGKPGVLFGATDTGIGYRDSGASWDPFFAVLDGTGKVNTSVLPPIASTLAGLTDVNLAGLVNGDLIQYDTGTSKWLRVPASSIGGTSYTAGTGLTLAGTVFSLSNVGPGATGPLGTAVRTPVVTINAQGQVTALTDIAIALTATGDATGTLPGALTLKNTGPGATGPLGSATTSAVVTIDAQGRVTGLTSAAIAIAESAVTNLTADLAAKFTTSTALGGDLTGTLPNPTLAAAGPGATGPLGSPTTSAVVTIDAKGRVTALTAAAIAIAESAVTNLVSDLALKAPLASPAFTGSPTAPTQAPSDNSTKLATTAYVDAGLVPVASLTKILAGTTIPTNSLDRWKAGRSLQATKLIASVTNAATTIAIQDPAIAPTTLHRRFTLDIAPNAEEIFTTAGEGAAILTGVTSVATTGIFTKTAHGLVSGQMVTPTTGILNSFLTKFTVYYVSATNLAANTFSLAATSGGSVLTGTTNDTNLTITLSQLTLTTRGNVNGSAAVAHALGAPLFATKVKTVFHAGDSVVSGTDSAALADDGWTIRTARSMSDRMGGLVAKSWPYWRNVGLGDAHHEYSSVSNGGLILNDTNQSHDCGWGGAINQAGVATTGSVITWTRPAGERVLALDFRFVDYGANATGFSYQVVDKNGVAGAWTNCPFSSIYSSGKGITRRLRIAVDDPVSFSWRSCNAAGTSKTVVFPFIPITTWAAYPSDQITEGVHWINAGWSGIELATILNARTVTDAVTDGSGGLTSATATFVANDVLQYCFVNGVQTTIATRTNGTTATTAAALAAGSGQRLTILQGSATGDWMADFYGHHGSFFPDLVVLGPFDNDAPDANNSSGMYGDLFQWLITQIQPCADILLIAPYEYSSGTADSARQASYRSVMHTIAAANNVAILDLYDFLVAYGITGYAGMVANSLLADLIHLNQKGNTMLGAHFTRVLSEL